MLTPRTFRNFRQDDAGSLTIFALFIFVLILMISGMAVDLMQHETRRVKMQNALDSAVLAAAAESQERDAREVIEERLALEGIEVDGDVIKVETSDVDGESIAIVTARVDTNTMFMNLMGIDSLSTPSSSIAVEKVTKIEISLVLDFTSSMKGSRRTSLIQAVDDFVNVVYQLDCTSGVCSEPDPDNEVTINVVPYGGTVNPGRTMANMMGLQRWHDYSSCGEIPSSAYDDLSLPYGTSSQLPHFYIWNRTDASQAQEFGWCPQDSNTILYAADHPQDVKNYIRTLELNDGTGSDIGMKWGMALLDPSSRDEINTLIDAGLVTGDTSRRFPEDYANNILKVAVLMTDGGITFQSRPTIFDYSWFYDAQVLDQKPDDLSEFDHSYEWYYNPDMTDPFVSNRLAALERFGSLEMEDGILALDEDGNTQFRPREDIEYNVAKGTRDKWRNNHFITRETAIAQLESQCALAKPEKGNGEERISIYTVRFLETKSWTEDYLKPCATPNGDYFDVQSMDDLDNAFSTIASHINNRKLSLAN